MKHAMKKEKRHTDRRKKRTLLVVCSVLAVVVALAVVIVSMVMGFLGKVNRESDLSGDVGINLNLPTEGVKNIALFGLDTRQDSQRGHSDAIIILSLDYTHNQIKMTSIARDSLVEYEGDNGPYRSKLTHAFWWGGQSLAVKTINRNYDMNITDFVYVNFYEFAEIIDYIGGVDMEVTAAEMEVMNRKYCGYIREMGIHCPDITTPGMQRLNGGQALAYSRNRYTGDDLERGNRQKRVLEAMYARIQDTPLSKYPALISRVLEMCHTNLTNREMLTIASWALTKQPTFRQFGLPSPACNAVMGDIGDGFGDVVRYDMEVAAQELYRFIYKPEETTTTTATTEE